MANKKNLRSLHYGILIYPENLIPGASEFREPFASYEDQLEAVGVRVWISPIHCAGGEKQHMHAVLSFESVKTPDQAREALARILSPMRREGAREFPPAEALLSLRSSVRYLCHLDQPKKQQWDALGGSSVLETWVLCLGGATVDPFELAPEDMTESAIAAAIEDFIDDNEITSYCVLSRYSRKNNKTWHEFLVTKAGRAHILTYLQSFHWTKETETC